MPAKTETSNFYTPFKYEIKNSVSDILKNTKTLVRNSRKYNSYLNGYLEKTQVVSYKVPEVSTYPILKNLDIIPIYKMNLQHEEEDIERICSRTKSIFNFKSEVSLVQLENNEEQKQDNNIRSTTHEETKCNLPFRTREQSVPFTENFFNELDLPLLNTENEFQYDVREIFHKQMPFADQMKTKVSHLKISPPKTTTNILTKTYKENTPREVSLTVQPLRIIFKNTSDKNFNHHELTLPFEYLPLFYYKDIEHFKLCLMGIIKFDETFESPQIDYKKLKEFISKVFDMEKKATIKEEPKQIDYKKFSIYAQKKQRNRFKHKEKKEKIFQIKDDVFIFNWITPCYVYEVEVRTPEIQFRLEADRQQINKFIDKELILYMHEHKFSNWDYYISKYLLSFKSFRNMIRSSFSKSTHLRSYSSSGSRIAINNVKLYTNHNLSKEKVKTYSFSDKKLTYLFTTKDNANFLYAFHGHSVKINQEVLEIEKVFNFSFEQMKKIDLIAEFQDLNFFFRKLLSVNENEGEIDFDYSYFIQFNPSYLRFWNYSTVSNEENNTSRVKIDVIFPHIEKKSFGNDMLLREIEIDHLPLDIVKRLNKKPIEFWAEILSGVNWAFKTNTDLRIEPNLTKANSKNFVVKDKRLSLFDRGMRSPHKKTSIAPKVTRKLSKFNLMRGSNGSTSLLPELRYGEFQEMY